MPFVTREEREWAAKTPHPTELSSRQIRTAWQQRIKDEAVFGARITHRAYLDAVKKRLLEVIGGTLTPQEAERRLKETLRDLGYSPEKGFGDGKVPSARPGDIRDLSSSRRIMLIIDTNVKRARSMGQVAASENPLMLMTLPAWKLTRTGARKKPRGNWQKRWAAAGASVGWKGALKRQMVALKTSPIWQALADGAGGFEDTLGSPYPPFAFGSGMAWVNVGRKEWQSMCAAEGVKDGLEDVTAKAKELKQDGGALKPVKVDFEVPELPVRVEPTDNPLLDEPKSMTIAPAPVFSRASTPDFTPNFSARAKANDAVDDALDEARNVAADVGKWLSEVDAKVKELESGGLDATMVYGPRNELRRLAEELRSLQGRITNYGGEVETTPLPVNKYDQGVYDSKMKRYEYSARSTARRVTAMHRSASSQYTAAMREADLA